MGFFIGMDEAGYGPNLGPLIVTATVWEVPGNPQDADFWRAMADVASACEPDGADRLHVADSKQVYNPTRGIANLEQSVLCLLGLLGKPPASFRQLRRFLTVGSHESDIPSERETEPWFDGNDLPLPHATDAAACGNLTERWHRCCRENGFRLRAVRSDVISPFRFNGCTQRLDNKAAALSQISLSLLRQVWDPDESERTLIVADKHGGRNRYDPLLEDVLDGQMIFRLEESRRRSCYRVGSTEIRFQMQAESHFAVAAASLVCKYVRELAMMLFNRFWCEHLPDLKPTKGYPRDARRFRDEIAAVQKQLGIPDSILWRVR